MLKSPEKEKYMRKKIFEIIEPSQKNSILSSVYDSFMIIVILLSLLPLCFKQTSDEKFSDLKRKNPETRRSKRGAMK